MTRNAEMILDIVNSSCTHPTAEDIYVRMNQGSRKVVLATVYNNLNSLCDKGLIRRIPVEGSPDRYDKTERHDHLLCSECGAISDFYMDDITGLLEKKLGDSIISYDLRCHYICPACKRKLRQQSAL